MRYKLPFLKHSQDAKARDAGGQMFECVSADNVRQGKNQPVFCFADLCDYVEASHHEQVESFRVTRRQEQRNEKCEQSIKLDGSVETQVAGTSLFRQMPLEHASYANRD